MTYLTFTKVNLHSVYMEAIIQTGHHTIYDGEHRLRKPLRETGSYCGGFPEQSEPPSPFS